MQCGMKSPHHCQRAASDTGDSWLQLTIRFYVLWAILHKTHTKQDVTPPLLYKQGKFQTMMSNVLHYCGKRVLLPTFVLSLLLVGILSKVTKANFYFLQNNEPHSKRPEGKGTTLSTSSLLKCPNSTWPCFLFLPGAVLCTPIRLPSLLWETTFYYFVPVSLHKTHFSLSINLSHYMQSYPTWATLGVYCLQMLAEGYHILLL